MRLATIHSPPRDAAQIEGLRALENHFQSEQRTRQKCARVLLKESSYHVRP